MLFNKSFFKDVSLLSGGIIIGQIFSFFILPVLARIYSATEFGFLTSFTTIIALLMPFTSLRYVVTIPLPEKKEDAFNIFYLCLIINFIVALFLLLIFILGINFNLFENYNLGFDSSLLILIPLSLLLSGIFEQLTFLSLKFEHFKSLTISKILQSLSGNLIKLILGVLGHLKIGLILGFLLQDILGITFLFSKLKNKKFKPSFNKMKMLAYDYIDFPKYQLFSQFILKINASVPVLALGAIYNFQIIGYYALANTIISIPMKLIANSISQVYYSKIANFKKSESKLFLKSTLDFLKIFSKIIILPVILIAFFSEHLFVIFFGSDWKISGEMAQFLIFITAARFLSMPIISVLNVLKMQKLQLMINILRFSLLVFVFSACYYLSFDALGTIAVYSLSMFFFYTIVLFKIILLLRELNE